jgi:hypothetical protein
MSVSNQQVAHSWAHGTPAKGSNLKTDGVTLTSYSTTIAARLDDVIYISSDNMSPSTGRHLSYARQAVNHERERIFRTPAFSWSGSNPAATHEALTIPAAREAIQTLDAAMSATRTRKQTKLDAIAAYLQERERIQTHAARFNVKLPDMPEYALDLATVTEYADRKAAERARLEATRQAAALKQQKADAKQFKIWLTTGAGRCPASYQRREWDQLSAGQPATDYITIHDGLILTSQGAECPLDHAVKALRFWQSRRGEPYHTNGHVIHLGAFILDSIAEDGTVKAGCHTFTAAEINRFIAQWHDTLAL